MGKNFKIGIVFFAILCLINPMVFAKDSKKFPFGWGKGEKKGWGDSSVPPASTQKGNETMDRAAEPGKMVKETKGISAEAQDRALTQEKIAKQNVAEKIGKAQKNTDIAKIQEKMVKHEAIKKVEKAEAASGIK